VSAGLEVPPEVEGLEVSVGLDDSTGELDSEGAGELDSDGAGELASEGAGELDSTGELGS
jgi:hypothetical protein